MVTAKMALSPMEVARELGLNRRTVYRLIAENKIRHARAGFKILVSPKAIDEYLMGNPKAA